MKFSCGSFWANCGLKYTVVVFWLSVNALLLWYTYNQYRYSPHFYYLHEILGTGLCVSRGTAAVINLNLGVLLIPVCRTILATIRSPGRMVPMRTVRIIIDHCKGFHVFCAYILVVSSVVHFFGHCFNVVNFSEHYNTRVLAVNAASKPKENPFLIVLRSVPGVTGLLLLAILSVMISSAIYAFRSACYDIFWYVHRLFIVFYVLVFVHGMKGILMQQSNVSRHTPGCAYINNTQTEYDPNRPSEKWTCLEEPTFKTIGSSTWLWTIAPLCMYIGDTLYRNIHRQRDTAILTGVCLIHDKILVLRIRKQHFKCRPGQYVMLQYPEISSFEWHPYTVTKIPTDEADDEFSIHVKLSGDWSAKLKNHLLEEYMPPTDSDTLLGDVSSRRILVDGPFGSPMEDVLKYRVCLCVAGGIGITPFIALLNYIRATHQPKLHRLYLIWVSRDMDIFLCFADLLCDIYNQFWQSSKPDLFSIKLFTTAAESSGQAGYLERHELLKRRLFYGRPEWVSVLCKIANTFPGDKVGVFCCGSKSLSTEVGSCCVRSSCNRTKFHFYHESF